MGFIFDINGQGDLGQESLAHDLSKELNVKLGEMTLRQFPDGEFYVRCFEQVKNEDCYILCHLHHPNEKALAIIFLAETLKELGAKRIHLIAPYLAYMRQDIRFHEGEGISSRYFAKLMSHYVDSLITVDPHLHRYHSLGEIYSIPASSLTAVEPIAQYIKQHINNPVVIGPDGESEQWAKSVAIAAGCPYEVLTKERFGDRDVKVSLPHVENYLDHTPVLVDDIISTGKTMMQAAQHLTDAGLPLPTCIGVHAVFADGAAEEMAKQQLTVVTCDSIPHGTNKISLSGLLATGIQDLIKTL